MFKNLLIKLVCYIDSVLSSFYIYNLIKLILLEIISISIEYHVSIWYGCCILAIIHWKKTLVILFYATLYGIWYWTFFCEPTTGFQKHIQLFI